jgi:dipeptidyl aminopeptidase/acylaminoacyl peptidase
MMSRWRRGNSNVTPTPGPTTSGRRWRQSLVELYGSPEQNPAFWASISANSYLASLSGPVQLHHGTADHDVPVEFSQTLAAQIQQVGREVELYLYEGDDHNIATNLGTALSRSVAFFDTYVKNGDVATRP